MVLAPAPKICRPISQHQIAIEPAAAGYSPFRDFVHCRFADAGRRWVWLRSPTAGIRKPSQEETHALQQLRRYSITSSARASSEGGMVSPIAFAALILITNSNFVA